MTVPRVKSRLDSLDEKTAELKRDLSALSVIFAGGEIIPKEERPNPAHPAHLTGHIESRLGQIMWDLNYLTLSIRILAGQIDPTQMIDVSEVKRVEAVMPKTTELETTSDIPGEAVTDELPISEVKSDFDADYYARKLSEAEAKRREEDADPEFPSFFEDKSRGDTPAIGAV